LSLVWKCTYLCKMANRTRKVYVWWIAKDTAETLGCIGLVILTTVEEEEDFYIDSEISCGELIPLCSTLSRRGLHTIKPAYDHDSEWKISRGLLCIECHNWRQSNVLCADNMAWKRPVKGIREMCDSCSTTLFNMHWTCTKCGHAVCLDCYNALRQCAHSADGECCKPCKQIVQRCCVRRQLHDIDDLMPTQIIPTDGLLHFWLVY